MQPIQQQGRRFPPLSSEITRLTCSSMVFCCLTVTVQQIHSLRASGVISPHAANALGLETSAFFRSFGSSCTTLPAISFLVIKLYYFKLYFSIKQHLG